jgi:hypothetical protein
MSLFPLGILSAAGAGGVGATYELIESQILGSNQSSITFSSLATYASTYKHLQIRAAGKGSGNSFEETNVNLRFNGDTGSNYSAHF